MVSNIDDIRQSFFPSGFSQRQNLVKNDFAPLNSFDSEDEAIISSQAKLQYESEKFNSGEGDALDLALAQVIAKTTVEAEVSVIQTKKEMLDSILELGN